MGDVAVGRTEPVRIVPSTSSSNHRSSDRLSAAKEGKAVEPAQPAAVISGVPIAREKIVEPLMGTHGVSVLEDLIVLHMAEREAETKGVAVTPADIEREYEITLERLSHRPDSLSPEPFDRERAERLLQSLRAERGVSPEQFRLTLRRNAVLRKLVERDLRFSDDQLQEEFARGYGERVQVRHIQLATLADISRIREKLDAGEDFAELARRFSADTSTAAEGGLLDPFSAADDTIPLALRQSAFKLSEGQVSSAVRVGEWTHILMLERRIPSDPRNAAERKPELERRLRARRAEPAIQALARKLFEAAEVQVLDPVLREGYMSRHPAAPR